MSTVINKTTLQIFELAHTPNFTDREGKALSDLVINPDLKAVIGVPKKYWKFDGNTFVPMTPAEKASVDTAEVAAMAQALDQEKDVSNLEKLTKAAVLLIFDEINKLRTKAGLATYTLEQLRTAIKTKFDTL